METAGEKSTWLTLGQASRILGVDPDTLRRWSDGGKVEVFTTPGGHRRFTRAAIDSLLPRPAASRRPALSALGEPPDRVAAEFRRRVRTDMAAQSWHDRFDEQSLKWFRERGMRMSELLVGALDTMRREGREQLIIQAAGLGSEYGTAAAKAGLSLGEATQAFLYFRARFMGEIAQVARRRSLETNAASALFEGADRALDRVILALITAHQQSG